MNCFKKAYKNRYTIKSIAVNVFIHFFLKKLSTSLQKINDKDDWTRNLIKCLDDLQPFQPL